MRSRFFGVSVSIVAAAALFMVAVPAAAQETATKAAVPAKPAPGAADGHPDLNGIWTAGGIPFRVQKDDGSIRVSVGFGGPAPAAPRPAAAPNVPSYKPELHAKVKHLFDNESKLDQVFYCGKPGVPRIGPPRRSFRRLERRCSSTRTFPGTPTG